MILNSQHQHIPCTSATRASFGQTLLLYKLGQMSGCSGPADFGDFLILATADAIAKVTIE
jgi:hypothetical protein